MRFAWLREHSEDDYAVESNFVNQLILVVYNVVWWVPIVLAFADVIDYEAGFIGFAAITMIRAAANFYRNNFLAPEQALNFPLRSP